MQLGRDASTSHRERVRTPRCENKEHFQKVVSSQYARSCLPPRVSNCARQSRVPGEEQEGQGKGSGGQADGAEAGLVFKKVQLHTGHMTDDLRAIQVTMTKERGGLLV